MPDLLRAADVSTLRRISLLVLRAGEDDDAMRQQMNDIREVIDQLKKDVALGSPFPRDNVQRLDALVAALSRRSPGRRQTERLQEGVFIELRDLAASLREAAADSGN